jgi:hypothetical protein
MSRFGKRQRDLKRCLPRMHATLVVLRKNEFSIFNNKFSLEKRLTFENLLHQPVSMSRCCRRADLASKTSATLLAAVAVALGVAPAACRCLTTYPRPWNRKSRRQKVEARANRKCRSRNGIEEGGRRVESAGKVEMEGRLRGCDGLARGQGRYRPAPTRQKEALTIPLGGEE